MGYRACPELVHICVGTELETQIAELLSAARDIGIARAAGLSIPREARPREKLSPREQEVCDLLSQGLGNRAIAKALFISESTTKVHVRHIFEKLGVHSRAEVARIAGARVEG
ncbi:MAG: response regulator transcription factor [Acidobacteriota bacterium]|nr:response regulator transcription factor [Acidobacteriota bacterium]